ncbi:MAG: sulfotransferase [Gammaproteobacteria bacterium]|nr:sulfotransferase [Gammaproteobacteria bacterium]MCK5091253.1 sulfotransferase [Gammaproteobacteria bacterium]
MKQKKNILTKGKKERAKKLLHNRQFIEARDLYRALSKIDPRDHEIWYGLGIAYGEIGSYAKSETCLCKAVGLQPDNLEIYDNLGSCLELQEKFDEAIQIYRKVLAKNPGSARTTGSLARLYEKLGDTGKSYNLIKPFVTGNIDSLNIGLTYAKICKYQGDCDTAISYLLKLSRNPNIHENGKMQILFALGDLHEKNGEFDESFRFYLEANRLKHAYFDTERHKAYIQNIISTYKDQDTISHMPKADNRNDSPVFIVGMPRSGTTLVEQILSSHSQVYGGGELSNIIELVDALESGNNKLDYTVKLGTMDCNQLAQKHLDFLLDISGNALRVTDKMPFNYLHLGLISLLFPHARIIHCIRHPLDCCISSYFIDFMTNNFHAYDLTNLGIYFSQYKKLMDHWESVLSIPILNVVYEDLVNNQESVSRSMIDFIDLDWESDCLHFDKSRRYARTASYNQVRQPIYTKSIGRWKNYKQYLGSLVNALDDKNLLELE